MIVRYPEGMIRLVLAAALCASTGCIITEDSVASGVTLELSWECPADAQELGIVAFPLDEDGFIDGEGVPDTFDCANAQPARFLYDPGDWYVEATPDPDNEQYYKLWDTFTGEEMETAELDFTWDPNLGAFQYHWEIGGSNPATGCNSRDVTDVTLTATVEALPDETYSDTFPCNIATAQSRPLPLDRYLISGAPDDGAETVVAEAYELVDPSGLLDLPAVDIAVAAE
jgi:hypothetical protein